MFRTGLIAATACVALLVLGTSVAAAQSPVTSGYGESSGGVVEQIEQSSPTPSRTPPPRPPARPVTRESRAPERPEPSASLPFTGLEIGAMVLMGLVLVGTGVALHRAGRPTGSSAA